MFTQNAAPYCAVRATKELKRQRRVIEIKRNYDADVGLQQCSPMSGPNAGAVIPKAIAVPVLSLPQHRDTSTPVKLKISLVALLLVDCSKLKQYSRLKFVVPGWSLDAPSGRLRQILKQSRLKLVPSGFISTTIAECFSEWTMGRSFCFDILKPSKICFLSSSMRLVSFVHKILIGTSASFLGGYFEWTLNVENSLI